MRSRPAATRAATSSSSSATSLPSAVRPSWRRPGKSHLQSSRDALSNFVSSVAEQIEGVLNPPVAPAKGRLSTATLSVWVAVSNRIPASLCQIDCSLQESQIQLHIDRGYIKSPVVAQVLADGGQVHCKPWSGHNKDPELFAKSDCQLDMRARTITCPMGQVERFQLGSVVQFAPHACGPCPARAICTSAAPGSGRTGNIRG